jgi:hypothetical protein
MNNNCPYGFLNVMHINFGEISHFCYSALMRINEELLERKAAAPV